MHRKPSLLADLTPEEILRYWSLLTPEQREAFLERRIDVGGELEGLLSRSVHSLGQLDTVFDRFAGLYHAFERLYRSVEEAINREELREAEARLFGEKYDSLPVLLQKVSERKDADPIMGYATFLCARQIAERVRAEFPSFWESREQDVARLESQLSRLEDMRQQLLAEVSDREEFLKWYEEMFLMVAEPETEVAT